MNPITPAQLPEFVDLVRDAYPMFIEDRDRAVEAFRKALDVGYPALLAAVERSGRMVGTYADYRFVATILGRGLPASGLGMVATRLDCKKQRVALAIVRDFVRRTRREKLPLSFLYPFRHDFYADMGWAPVAESRQHFLPASSLPLYPERRMVRLVREPDWKELDRVHRSALGLHGALGLSRHPSRWTGLLRQAQQVYVASEGGRAEGYLLARFGKRPGEPDGFRYDLEVMEMEWVTPRAMRGLLGLLSSQRDQVVELILDWPRDGHLDAVLREPLRRGAMHLANHQGHGPIAALGAMLRLEDPAEAFRARPCSGADALALEVAAVDPLQEEKTVRFRAELRGDGAPEGRAAPAKLACGLGTLARLWAGALRVREAADFGLVEVSPPSAVAVLDRLLAAPSPWIVERF
jgi:predicted acetyltransferase